MKISKLHIAVGIFVLHALYVVFLYDFTVCLYETINGIDALLYKNNYGDEHTKIAFRHLSDLIRHANPYICSIFVLIGISPFFLLKKNKIKILYYIILDGVVIFALISITFYIFLKHLGSFIWVM